MDNLDFNLADLRAIIHALKMASLSFIEPEALTIIKLRITGLPSPEQLLEFTPKNLDGVRKEVGNIMMLIDSYGTKNFEFKERHKSLKNNLPPRYKVLDWKN